MFLYGENYFNGLVFDATVLMYMYS